MVKTFKNLYFKMLLSHFRMIELIPYKDLSKKHDHPIYIAFDLYMYMKKNSLLTDFYVRLSQKARLVKAKINSMEDITIFFAYFNNNINASHLSYCINNASIFH